MSAEWAASLGGYGCVPAEQNARRSRMVFDVPVGALVESSALAAWHSMGPQGTCVEGSQMSPSRMRLDGGLLAVVESEQNLRMGECWASIVLRMRSEERF